MRDCRPTCASRKPRPHSQRRISPFGGSCSGRDRGVNGLSVRTAPRQSGPPAQARACLSPRIPGKDPTYRLLRQLGGSCGAARRGAKWRSASRSKNARQRATAVTRRRAPGASAPRRSSECTRRGCGTLRLSTATCCRSARFSRESVVRESGIVRSRIRKSILHGSAGREDTIERSSDNTPYLPPDPLSEPFT